MTGARASFSHGAEWMRGVLATLRDGDAPRGAARFVRLGCAKYGLAVAAALVPCAVALAVASPWPALLGVPAFYAAEVQGVFAFPCALDGATSPLRASRGLVARSGGTFRAMRIVMPIAAVMLVGGLAGRGFRRSWCAGCAAVLLWYESARRAA